MSRTFRSMFSTAAFLVVGAAFLRADPAPLSDFTHRTWHVQDGLPDQIVQALAQTPDHYLWIGTTKGLLRFDGKTFVPYTSTAAEPLRHGVTALMVARDGSLYIGTEGGGLLRLRAGTMQQFGNREGIANQLIRAILQDRDGTLWIGTDRGVYHSSGQTFQRMDHSANYPNLGSAALFQDRDGNVWSGGSRLLRLAADHVTEFELPLQNGSMRIKSICGGPDGSIWVGSVAGLYHQLGNGRFQKVTEVHGTVRTLGRMASGQIWAGTAGDGLYLQHGSRFEQVQAPVILPSNTVLSQTTDRDGNVWLGTQAGLLRLSRSGMHLIPLPNAQDSDFGTLFRDTNGSLWICSSQLFRTVDGHPSLYRFAGLGDITIRTMLRERSGALWLGTTGRGAYRVAPNGKISHYTAEIGTNYIRSFLQSPDGSVWIGTDGGVAHFHNSVIDNFHEIAHAPHTLTLAMAEDRNQRLWIGTQRGITTLNHGAFEDLPATKPLHEQAIWSLAFDPDGTLWIGADTGLYRLRNNILIQIPLDIEAPTPAVYEILKDPRHNSVWIGGPTRVLRLPIDALDHVADKPGAASLEPEIFPVSNEIQAAEMYGGMQPSGLLDPDGSAWFPTSQGPLHLIPRKQLRDDDIPLVIERILVDGRSIEIPSSLHLPAGTRTLQIDYAPVLLSSQVGLRFRHRLEGFDDWSSPSSSRSAIYTNLPGRDFRFVVEALYGKGGQVSSVKLPIQQQAFFYHRPWFWTLCALSLAVIIWAIYRVRIHQIKIRFRTIAAERNRLAREMHDTLVQGCVAVSALLEGISVTIPDAQPSHELIDIARQQIRTTIDDARDAVWNLRSAEPAEHELGSSLRKLLDQCLKNTSVESTFHTEGSEPTLDYSTAHELLMSTREALLNAAAHSAATRIDLGLHWSSLGVIITISDNGKGFDPKEAAAISDRHYGLIGMRERIEGLGGSFYLFSSMNSGTRLVFEVPCAKLIRQRFNHLEA